MISVSMMEVAINEIIDMVAVRHRFVPACRTVLVRTVVGGARVARRANSWVDG
jgi:hypothetical protein